MLLLTIAAKRLSKKNVLVKDLHGVETLGSITMLATDKTGTLTQNKMTATGCWINGRQLAFQNGFDSDEGDSVQVATGTESNIQDLMQAMCLCTKYLISHFIEPNLQMKEKIFHIHKGVFKGMQPSLAY